MTIHDSQDAMAEITLGQVLEFFDRQEDIIRVPGVVTIQLEFLDRKKNEVAVLVYLDNEYRDVLPEIPEIVGGMPVIVKLQSQRNHEIVEVIDLRRWEAGAASWRSYRRGPNVDLGQGSVIRP